MTDISRSTSIRSTLLSAALLLCGSVSLFSEEKKYGGIQEDSPSIPQYFSWINNTNEGATEEHTLINLDFFKWLHDDYGMKLGIYALDAGNIDSARYYGTMETEKFKKQWPNGFGPMGEKAKSFGCGLGLWGGPDGYGDTPEEEAKRFEMVLSLCRDYGFTLFKLDAVCGQLRPEKQDIFVKNLIACRKFAPNLIVLNHRLGLDEEAKRHTTTFLWGGRETYIDVHMANRNTATHNRRAALGRGLPPGLKRLTEDHGVCISSCLDYWEDDLVLQGFNRSLILAPQTYGNPWLLRDDEFPKLARIYNLHYRNRDILVKGIVLPKEKYGESAVARGDAETRFITLRNLTWEPKSFKVKLDQEIGLTAKGDVHVRRYHPSEKVLGDHSYGETVEVTVDPFRSYLLMASVKPAKEVGVTGCDYEVVQDVPGKPVKLKLLGWPGSKAKVSLYEGERKFTKATINGKDASKILKKSYKVKFPGKKVSTQEWHRKLADLKPAAIPADVVSLYESTAFGATNEALEVQSVKRSGPTKLPHVQKTRDAFFNQDLFWRRGIKFSYLFDENIDTFYGVFGRETNQSINGGALRLDMKESKKVEQIKIQELWEGVVDEKAPMEMQAQVSSDLENWKTITFTRQLPKRMRYKKVEVARVYKNGGEHDFYKAFHLEWTADVPAGTEFRYLKLSPCPKRIAELELYNNKERLKGDDWTVTTLFADYDSKAFHQAWVGSAKIEDRPVPGAYICVALNGHHGRNGAFAALRVDGKWVGAPQRAPSYPSTTFEYPGRQLPSNYTYFFPVTEDMHGKKIDIVAMGLKDCKDDLKVDAWITTYPNPYRSVELVLE